MMTDLLLIVASQDSQKRIREELGETRCRCDAREVIGSARTPRFRFWPDAMFRVLATVLPVTPKSPPRSLEANSGE
jgi:hypothetical protein